MLHDVQTWLKNHKILSSIATPELFVVFVLLVFGSFLAFKVPLGAGFDEETHLLRVWEMSAFEWIPNAKLSTQMHFPAFYWDNSYRRQAILEPVDPNFWSNYADTSIEASGDVPENLTTRSVYSPLLLLPHSLVMFFLGRVLHLPALTVLIAMRMAGLLCYTLLVWLAVRMASFGKWLWAILVVAPMAVYQASTISTDSISNGIGFLFVSCCLYITTLPQIKWKEWLILVLLFSLLFFAKVNMAILAFLPFFILPPSRFKMRKGFFLLGIVAILLALLEFGGWNLLAYSRFYTAIPGADPARQLQYLIIHPLSSVWLVISDLGFHILPYLKGWIADYGYGYWGGPPWFIYILYVVAVVTTFFISDDTKPDKRTRLGLVLVFGLSFFATLMSLYVSYTPVGSSEIQGVHGRYFTVIFPLLLLGLYGFPRKSLQLNRSLFTKITIGITLIGMMFFSAGMYLAFYVRCGTAYFHSGLCYQPVYKNWAPNTKYFQPISSKNNLIQWIIPKCNGMSSVRVWIDSASSDPNGNTQFIINDEEKDIVQVDLVKSNSDLPSNDWLTLTFPEDWKSGGKWYTLSVQNHQPEPGQGIRVASSIRAEYIDAPLFQDELALENDMIFQYGCISGWKALFHNLTTLLNKH
jgi:uncharacterized membrane protein